MPFPPFCPAETWEWEKRPRREEERRTAAKGRKRKKAVDAVFVPVIRFLLDDIQAATVSQPGFGRRVIGRPLESVGRRFSISHIPRMCARWGGGLGLVLVWFFARYSKLEKKERT